MIKYTLQFFGGRGSSGSRNSGGGSKPVENKELSQAEKIEAAEAYIGPEGFEINKMLRGQEFDDMYGSKNELMKYANNFETLLDEQSLKSATTVFRGTGYNAFDGLGVSADEVKKNPKILVGKTLVDNAFLSTANNYQTAKDYSRGDVVWKISLPKGAKAVKQSSLTPDGADEITIQRKAQLKVTRTIVSNGTLIINAKYTGIKK